MIQTAEILIKSKQKNEVINKRRRFPLSNSIAMRRTELLTKDLSLLLDEWTKTLLFF